MTQKNKLISWKSFDMTKVIFSDPKAEKMGQRITLSYRHDDGTIGDLLFATQPDRISYGVQHNTDIDDRAKILPGHKLSLALYTGSSPTADEKAWVSFWEHTLMAGLKQHLVTPETKSKLKMPKLTLALLEEFGKLWRAKDPKTGERPETDSNPPKFFAKLDEYLPVEATGGKQARPGRILTLFKDVKGAVLDPSTIMDVRCEVTAVLAVRTIFFGSKISPQVKLKEARVRVLSAASESFLDYSVEDESPGFVANPESLLGVQDDTDSIKSDDEEVPPPVAPPVVKKPVPIVRSAKKA